MKKKLLFLIIACLTAISHAAAQDFYHPEFLGSWRTSFSKTVVLENVAGRLNNLYYYSFTLLNSMDITVSHCKSEGTTNTGIFIMDENENILASDGGYNGACAKYGLAEVTVPLPAGTYIIWIDWAPDSLYGITTEITGTSPNIIRTVKNISTCPEAFTWRKTSDTSDPDKAYQIPGPYQNGICYGFTFTKTMDIVISHCGSEVDDTYVYLLDSKGNCIKENNDFDGIDACGNPRHAYLGISNLPAGTYYVVSKGMYGNGNITTQVTGEIAGNIPAITGFSEDIGEFSTFFNYTDTKDTRTSGYPGYGDYRAGISYEFLLLNDMDITISNCGSTVQDTRIYLLDMDGEVIARNDDYSGINACENTQHAYLDTHLKSGIYHVVSTGAHERGNITTQIVGRTTEMKIGSRNKNYTISRSYKDASGYSWQDKLDYYDEMGRPEQTVLTNASPDEAGDIVTFLKYDAYGRQNESWLPAVIAENTGEYVPFNDFINGTDPDYSPVSLTEYETSPLDRPINQYGPGDDWHIWHKGIKTEYQLTNIEGDKLKNCIHYQVVNETVDGDTLVTVKMLGNYPTGTFTATRTMDEDDNPTLTFKNRFDQVVLSRQILNDGTKLCDTYYIYDEWGNLHAVLPPLASNEMASKGSLWNNASDAVIRRYAYLYKYDERFRMTAKRRPGQDWLRYVYDKSDIPVFTQDGEQRKRGEWSFSITDGLERVCLTGVCKNSFDLSVSSLNTVVNAERDDTKKIYKGYSISGVALLNPQVMTVNYYDNYEFMGKHGIPAPTEYDYKYDKLYDYDNRNTNGTQSLLTGSLTAQLNGADTISYLPAVMYYDYRGRLIQSKTATHLTGGIDKEYTAYDFTGKPVKHRIVHSAKGKQTQTEEYTYTYDYMDRLLDTQYTLTGRNRITLANNEYDSWGRLKTNKRNGNPNLRTDYTYNVRSWVKSISNPLFSQTLYYNDSRNDETNVCRYNGSISAMDWSTVHDSIQRGYNFTYDGLSQLRNANYRENQTESDKYNTSYEYDEQGNILHLSRYGQTGTNSYGLIDNLTFTLNGNQLQSITDAASFSAYNNGFEFKDSIGQHTEYLYDTNGNLTKDLNKKITDIQYNFLNLPYLLTFEDGSTIAYTYDANGKKLQTIHNIGGSTVTKDYCRNVIYENGVAKLLLTDAGYITLTDKKHHFFLQDHQGNNRVVADESGNIEETNHYYPFGGTFASAVSSTQPYKYNGKELDTKNGLNWYDYGARMYDPAIGRWHAGDPVAEEFYRISPYAYCYNSPILLVDPNGMWPTWGGIKRGFNNALNTSMSFANGAVRAVADNMLWGNTSLRETGIYSSASAYNAGQDVGDMVSIFIGGAEAIKGAGEVTAGVLGTPETAGASLTVSAKGAVDVTHGSLMATSGAMKLFSRKGRVNQSNDSEYSKTSGRNGPHSNLDKRQQASNNYKTAKENYDNLNSKPLKTQEENKLLKKLEKQVKHWKKKQDFPGENHSMNTKGN